MDDAAVLRSMVRDRPSTLMTTTQPLLPIDGTPRLAMSIRKA